MLLVIVYESWDLPHGKPLYSKLVEYSGLPRGKFLAKRSGEYDKLS